MIQEHCIIECLSGSFTSLSSDVLMGETCVCFMFGVASDYWHKHSEWFGEECGLPHEYRLHSAYLSSLLHFHPESHKEDNIPNGDYT